MKDILKFLQKNIFVITLVFIAIVTITIVIGTFATDIANTSNADLSYTFTLGKTDLQSFTVNAGETKLIEFKVKNTNNHAIKYGIVYKVTDNTNVTVKETDYSVGHIVDSINKEEMKIVSVEIKNSSDINQTFDFSTVLGYENGGELTIPTGYQLVAGNKQQDITGTNLIKATTDKGNLTNYRIYGNTIKEDNDNLLPDIYKQVEYIEGTGTQYIDTNYSPNSDTIIELKHQLTSIPTFDNNACLIGGWMSNKLSLVRFYTDKWLFYYGSDITEPSTITPDTYIHTLKIDKNDLYLDDSLILSKAESTFTGGNTLSILAQHNSTSYARIASARIYYLKIYDNDKLVRDFIPCYRKSDNEIGLYDLVNNVFYTNKGSGTFKKGSDVSSLSDSVEMKNVGDSSKNLLDINNFPTQTKNGVTFTNNGDGTVTVNGTATDTAVVSSVVNTFNLQEDGRITIKVISGSYTSTDGSTLRIGIYDSTVTNGGWTTPNNKYYYTLSKDYTYTKIRFEAHKDDVYNNLVLGIQVEEGSTATDFIPYNKYNIPIKISGKNLFHTSDIAEATYRGITYSVKDDVLYLKGTTPDNLAFYVDLLLPSVLPSNNYYIYRHAKGTYDKEGRIYVRYGATRSIKGGSTKALGNYNGPYSVSNTIGNISIMVHTGVTVDMEIRLSIGLVKNETRTYSPYYDPILTNIYLDEPLRRVGGYADYIDFKTKKVVRYIGVIDSYNGEKIDTDYISSTGDLDNGATVYYVLEVPSITSIDLPDVNVNNDTNTFNILSGVSPSKFMIRYYGV